MIKFKYILGFLWTLPTSILAWAIVAFIYINHGVEFFLQDKRLICVVDLNTNHWFYRTFFKRRGWKGWSFGHVAFVYDVYDESRTSKMSDKGWSTIVVHEATHCLQQYKWGILFYPVYFAESVWLWFRHKKKHSYLDNRFEREARRMAGQTVDRPPETWPDGPEDRWRLW